MEKPYVAVRSIYTGRVEYCTEGWLFHGSELNAMPCKEIRYVDMLHCGMESYYQVTFKANQYGDIAITTTGEEDYTQFDFNFTEEQWAVIVDTISVQLRAQKLSS